MNQFQPKIILVRIQFNSLYINKDLRAIEVPPQCHILGIIRNDNLIHPRENTLILEEDMIIALAINPGLAQLLKYVLKKTRLVSWCYLNRELQIR